jgi:putative FmdB family regulatory protein
VPTYQYTCTDCGEPVEAVQKFTDDPLTVCAACGGRLRKVFSPVGIVFKGSGFYRTDSRNGPVSAPGVDRDKKDKSSSESKSTADSNGSADKADKADKTPAKKSEPVSTAAKSSSEKVA